MMLIIKYSREPDVVIDAFFLLTGKLFYTMFDCSRDK